MLPKDANSAAPNQTARLPRLSVQRLRNITITEDKGVYVSSQLFSCVFHSPHTCDKFQKGIREILLSFQGGFSKVYRTHRKILNSDEGDFQILVKSGMF